MIQFEKPLDTDSVNAKIQARIIEAHFNYDLWKKIESACKKFEGKQFSKRIETEIKKLLPDYTVYYESGYMYHLVIWGNGIDYNNRKSFMLGYDSNPVFSSSEFLRLNMWAELELGRAEKLESIDKTILANEIYRWNEGLELLQGVYKWAEKNDLNYTAGFDISTR